MRQPKDRIDGENFAYWVLWIFTAFLACAVTFIIYLSLLDRFSNFAQLPAQSEEYREYKQPKACYDNARCDQRPFSKLKHDDGEADTKVNKECEKECESTDVVSNFIKDKRDLNAQEGMWRAAYYLVALTGIQILVGVITILALGLTLFFQRSELGQAKRAANAAEESLKKTQELGILEYKPYLRVSSCNMDDIVEAYGKIQSFCEITIENVGRSPARNLCHFRVESIKFVGRDWPAGQVNQPKASFDERTWYGVLNPKDSVNVAARIVFDGMPSFGSKIESCYEMKFSFIFAGISADELRGKYRQCVFQMQRTPKHLSDPHLTPIEKIETIDTIILVSDEVVQQNPK